MKGITMHVIRATNVRDALPKAVRYIIMAQTKEHSRNGDVWVSPTPVAIRYEFPKQHVLRNPVRDANPFFHLMEAMWILAGRNDGVFLDHYIKDFSKLYGNKQGRIVDAYGYRLRVGLGFDQLEEAIKQLSRNKETRQVVLQMWGAGYHDLLSKEAKPCNLVITLRVFKGQLDMTVFNRSNDLIWGACGANAVHFAILQEYLASMIGIKLGIYWQVSTNLHLYEHHYDALTKKAGDKPPYIALKDNSDYETMLPLVQYPEAFDEELAETMDWVEGIQKGEEYYDGNLSNAFLGEVVLPMAAAHKLYKDGKANEALDKLNEVPAFDWREAGKEWIIRRMQRDNPN